MKDWLLRKSFVTHSGAVADWKIEADAFTDEEIETFALLIHRRFSFACVTGIPRGGWRIANALQKYCNRWTGYYRILVDDVLTTGASMEQYRESSKDIGVVLFARGPCPSWVYPVFQLWVP